jgi:phage shock protein PspC (stress-responsive transcriptional regulator)
MADLSRMSSFAFLRVGFRSRLVARKGVVGVGDGLCVALGLDVPWVRLLGEDR